MELIFSFVAFGAIALLAAISPGPDFLVVAKNSLAHSRKIGMYTGVGVGLAVMVHVSYTVVGIGLIISRSIVLFSTIKIIGAVYLMFLGTQILIKKDVIPDVSISQLGNTHKGSFEAFREGFLTNVLNPKATVFFVSVFTQFVSPTLPAAIQALYGVEAAIIVGMWFVVLALALTLPSIKGVISRFQSRVLKVMGAALVLLGLRIAFSSE